jgi:multimeric flavodoxin WrbA
MKEAQSVGNINTRILGISGTPIKGGNCDRAVEAALKAAAQHEGVETEFITLADKKISSCMHCQECILRKEPCSRFKDDATWIIDKMARADGMIWGAPVWTHVIPPQFINLTSRCRYQVFFTGDFRNIVFGSLTVCWFGVGEEFALMTMEAIACNWLMIPVARAWAKISTAAYGERPRYMEKGVLDDSAGMLRVRTLGTRVAEIASKIKYADGANIGVPPHEQRSITCGTFPLWQLRKKLE